MNDVFNSDLKLVSVLITYFNAVASQDTLIQSLNEILFPKNQNEVLGMSLYPIETCVRNLPDFGRKLIPRQLLA